MASACIPGKAIKSIGASDRPDSSNITSSQLKTQQASLTTAAEGGRGWHILIVQGVHSKTCGARASQPYISLANQLQIPCRTDPYTEENYWNRIQIK